MKLVIYMLIGFILTDCSNNYSPCVIRKDDFLKKSKNNVFDTDTVKRNILGFRDKGTDSIEGGYYTFYDNGNLKSYQFIVDDQTCIYREEYDSLGYFKKMERDPSVRKIAIVQEDESLLIKLLVCTQ